MLKGLEGIRTHEHREWLPIVENRQDWSSGAPSVRAALDAHPDAHGLLLRGPRPLHLGPRPRPGPASPRGARVPAGGGGARRRARRARRRRRDGAHTDRRREADAGRRGGSDAPTWPGSASSTSAGSRPHPLPLDASAEEVLAAYGDGDRAAEGERRLRDRGRDRRPRADPRPRRHAGEVPPRALARRGRGALHHRRARHLPLPPAAGARSSPSRSRPAT